jgi:formylglycine-generating enzyme required for sulfatase activity
MNLQLLRSLPAGLAFILLAATLRADEQPAGPPSSRQAGKPYVERVPLHYVYDPTYNAFVAVKPGQERSSFVKLEMEWIPAGSLRVPADAPGAKPRDVAISGCWMSKYEVTADLFYEWYMTFEMGRRPGTDESRDKVVASLPGPPRYFRRPEFIADGFVPSKTAATALTQYGAQQFCRWLSVREGRLYRLPTEAEWEYAARAGTSTRWHFGDDPKLLADYAIVQGKQKEGVPLVGRRKPNPWGLYDMYGNVAEWVLDGWSDDPYGAWAKGSPDPWVRRSRTQREGVVRGGDWMSRPDETRSASRTRRDDTTGGTWHYGWQWYDFGDEGRRIGFRVVSPAKPQADGREAYLAPFPPDIGEREGPSEGTERRE